MNIDQVRMLAHQVRLFGIHASLEHRVAHALADGHHPLELVRLLLEGEILERKNRVAKALTTRAKFRHVAALEDFDTSYAGGATVTRVGAGWPKTTRPTALADGKPLDSASIRALVEAVERCAGLPVTGEAPRAATHVLPASRPQSSARRATYGHSWVGRG